MMTKQVNKEPSLRFSEFDGKWKVSKLFESGVQIIDGDRGGNYPSSKDFSASGFCLFLNTKNVTKTGFSFQETMFVSKEKDAALSKGRLTMYDIVLTTRGTIGNLAYFDTTVPYKQIRINSGMVLLRSIANTLHPDYLYKFLSTGGAKKNTLRISFGSAQPQLTVKGIKTLRLAFPELSEQQKIADFLTVVDKRIEQLEEKKRLLTEYKKGVMQQIFSQQVRFKDDNGNPYPDWQDKRLGDICSVQSSKRVHQKDWTAFGVPFYRAREIVKMQKGEALKDPIFISQDKYEEIKSTYSMPVVNDILITGVGTIGIPYIIKNNDPFYFKDGNLLWLSNITVDSRWIYHCILEPKTMENIHNEAGSTVQTFTIQQAKQLLVPLPCIEEQRKISDLFGTLGDKVSQIAEQIKQAKTFKKGLLQQMFV